MERIKLNLIPSGVAPIVHLSQYDDGRQFGIDLFEGESVYVLDGTETLTVNSRKPDGHVVVLTVTNTGTSSLDVDTVEQLTAVHGVSYAKLQIVKGSVTIATLPFLIDVSRDPLENGDPSESFIQNLRTQIADGVAEEVATQYDSANVIFDNEPTENHGIGYTVTSEGIKTAIDNAFDYDNTASGSLVHITDGADNIPVKSLVSEIVAVESGNGQPKSPDNPYSISGFDSGVVSVIGKNWFDFEGWLDANSITYTKTGDSITFTPNSSLYTNPYVFSDRDINVSASVTNFTFNGTNLRLDFLDENGVPQTSIATGSLVRNNFNACKVRLNWSTMGTSVTVGKPMINLGTTVETYEPYNGNTYTFAFGQTVYGGHFDNKGNLVVTHKIVDMGLFDWNYLAVGDFYVFGYQFLDKAQNSNEMCSCYKVTEKSRQSLLNYELGTYNLSNAMNYVVIRDDDYTDATAFKTAMNGQKLVYELATPITLAITSQDIPTLLGENNIFSNCGDVEVTYYTNKSNDILEFVDSEIGKKNGTNILIEENSQDSIKDYIDNVSLSGLPDTDITGETSGQILAYDGANWVNTNQIAVKYEEKDITFDSTGEGTLYYANGYILGLKDIPSDSLYIGYITYMAGTKTMVKGFNRSATSFDSTAIANTTRKIGIYYLDNITTQ